MSKNTLFDKVWDRHTVRILPNGQTQLLIGLHLIHEVTSPQAFTMLRDRGLKVRFPQLTFATADHIIPTTHEGRQRPFKDGIADEMLSQIQKNCSDFGIEFFGLDHPNAGIVHVIGPELGLTQPGKTIACGDSHTPTHGGLGNIAFGIGTTQVFNVLATQCLLLEKPKVRRIMVNGKLSPGVYPKDVILTIIGELGVKGGIGYAYELAGEVVETLDIEGRMTLCNMTIEGGAMSGYVNPDGKTTAYLSGRPYAPKGEALTKATEYWSSVRSEKDAVYDNEVIFNGNNMAPMVTWGITPGQVTRVDGRIPENADVEALEYMGFKAGEPILGTKVNYAFVGSCTEGRISNLREAAGIIKRHKLKVAKGVTAIVVSGSGQVRKQAESEGIDQVFRDAGFDWRQEGCSMCLGMNPDQVPAGQASVSSSNRNFKGRQGKGSRTLLMSAASVVVSAAAGEVADVRQLVS